MADWDIKEPTSYESDDRASFAIELKADGDVEGVFTGHASVFNKKDLQDEVVEPGAFKRTLNRKKGKFPLLWQHDKTEPIGMVEAEEDGRGCEKEDAGTGGSSNCGGSNYDDQGNYEDYQGNYEEDDYGILVPPSYRFQFLLRTGQTNWNVPETI